MAKLMAEAIRKAPLTEVEGPVFTEFEFKFRARDGVFRIFLLLDHRSPALNLGTEYYWKQISSFLPESLAQSFRISLSSAANFGDVINAGSDKIFDMGLS